MIKNHTNNKYITQQHLNMICRQGPTTSSSLLVRGLAQPTSQTISPHNRRTPTTKNKSLVSGWQ